MNNDLGKEMDKLRSSVKKYSDLDEAEKIEEATNLKKHMINCKKSIDNYLKMVDNVEAYLSESPIENESEDAFKENLEKINGIKDILEKKKDKLTIDEKIALYVDLVKYTNYARDYLDKKKEVAVEYI